jgi:hypothetical protein
MSSSEIDHVMMSNTEKINFLITQSVAMNEKQKKAYDQHALILA